MSVARKGRLHGLAEFGLSPSRFLRLGGRAVHATIHMRTYDVTPEVTRRRPADRQSFLEARLNRWVSGIQRRAGLQVAAESHQPLRGRAPGFQLQWLLRVRGGAREIVAVSKLPGVRTVEIERIRGIRRRRSPLVAPRESWFCLRTLVAIQIEGRTTGMQGTEERFVAVRARTHEHAERRLERHWNMYARPYLNAYNELVRWQLDKVLDSYATMDPEPDPDGWEVYSKLGHRRMRPEFAWCLAQGRGKRGRTGR